MPAINKIDKFGLADRVLALAGEGKTTERIAEIITSELAGKDTVSQPTIARWLKKVRKERSDQTKQIFQDHIKVALPKDLEALEEIESFLLGVFRNMVASEENQSISIPGEYDFSTRVDAGMKAVKIIETKLRFSGVLEGSGPGDNKADPVDLDQFKREFEDLKDEVEAKK